MAKIKLSPIGLGQVTVTTAGTRVKLSASSRLARTVIIQALASNTGDVYIGDVTVSSTLGYILVKGTAITINADLNNEDEDTTYVDLTLMYADAANNGDKVQITVLDIVAVDYSV